MSARLMSMATAALLVLAGGWVSRAVASEPLVTISPEPASHAWWLRARFEPKGLQLYGLPLATFDRNWCAADFWEPSVLPRDAFVEAFAGTGLSFTTDWDPTGHRRLLVKVGVYKSCKGRIGNFIALLDRDGKRPQVHRVFTYSSEHPFAALKVGSGNALEIWRCSSCDDYDAMAWDPKHRKFISIDTQLNED